MISVTHLTTALYGAYRLARADRGGMKYFDSTLDGFWLSFFAAALVAPFFFLLILIKFKTDGVDAAAFRYFSIESIAYTIGWILFPLIVYYLVQALEREERYFGFIVAYNWASVIQNSVYLPFAILFELGVIEGGSAELINLFLLCLVLTYTWFVAKTALEVNGFVASGIIVLDVGVWIMLNMLTDSMLLV